MVDREGRRTDSNEVSRFGGVENGDMTELLKPDPDLRAWGWFRVGEVKRNSE